MDKHSKLRVLKKIYDIHENFMSAQNLACKRYCDHCCTCNVAMTTLEGFFMLQNMGDATRQTLASLLKVKVDSPRFRPKLSTNQMASMCAEGQDIPDEEIDPGWGVCPFLEEHDCSLYTIRPFGCRCMVSKAVCSESGFAQTDDLILSVNTIIIQYIEHLDQNGCYGNMIDVLSALISANNRGAYLQNSDPTCNPPLIKNSPLNVLMCPPQHRQAVQPILRSLAAIRY